MKDKITVECSCGHSFLAVWDADDGEVGLTLFTCYNRDSLWQRFVSAIKYLWTGVIESDEILLHKDNGIKLRDYLNEIYNDNK